MKKILLMLSCLLIITKLCFAEQPTIKDSEVERTYFFLTDRAGAIDGYLIFYDKDGQQCAVKGGAFKARLYCGGRFESPSFERTLDMNPSDFQWFNTKGGDTYYGYVIKPFLITGEDESVTVNFEWGYIRESTTVRRY